MYNSIYVLQREKLNHYDDHTGGKLQLCILYHYFTQEILPLCIVNGETTTEKQNKNTNTNKVFFQ